MTTTSNSASSLIGNNWLNQDSTQRLVTIEKLDLKEPGTAEFFLKVAQEDEHDAVRCSAIASIIKLDALELIRSVSGKVQESVQQQIHRIVAGTLESDHSEQERIDKLEQLPKNGAKHVALITKVKTIGNMAVGAVEQNEDLADICLFASSVHARKSAATKITDIQLLNEILTKVIGKDKTVSKTIANRLATDFSDVNEDISTGATPEPKKNKKVSKKTEKVEIPLVEPSIEFEAVEKEALQLSYKNASRLFEIRSLLRKLQARLVGAETNFNVKIDGLQGKIAEKNHQE